LTPLLRGGRVVAVVAGLAGQRQLEGSRVGTGVVLLTLAVVGGLGTLVGYISWRRTRFRVSDGQLELHQGVFVRRRRRVPIARVESIDVLRPLVARALGLAVLKVEAVSNSDSEIDLAYLPEARAEELRARLLAERAGLVSSTPTPDETVLVVTPLSALVKTALVVPVVLVLLMLAVTPVLLFLSGPAASISVGFVAFVTVVGGAAGQLGRLEASYGTTVAEAPDGLRVRRGLVNLRSQTVPLARVQAVRIVEPLLWRRWDWVKVVVDVAGYRGGGRASTAQSAVLLPVAPRALAYFVVGRLVPGLDLATVSLSPAPPAARLRAPVGHRALGVAWRDDVAVTVSGRFRRVTDVMAHRKAQSLRVEQGPWQRRLGLATLRLDSAGGSVSPAARHRTLDDALALLAASRRADLPSSPAGNP
jgi:putative membrane protein